MKRDTIICMVINSWGRSRRLHNLNLSIMSLCRPFAMHIKGVCVQCNWRHPYIILIIIMSVQRKWIFLVFHLISCDFNHNFLCNTKRNNNLCGYIIMTSNHMVMTCNYTSLCGHEISNFTTHARANGNMRGSSPPSPIHTFSKTQYYNVYFI